MKYAQKALTPILVDERLGVPAVLEASRATLTRPDKATVAAQLRLLAGDAHAAPRCRRRGGGADRPGSSPCRHPRTGGEAGGEGGAGRGGARAGRCPSRSPHPIPARAPLRSRWSRWPMPTSSPNCSCGWSRRPTTRSRSSGCSTVCCAWRTSGPPAPRRSSAGPREGEFWANELRAFLASLAVTWLDPRSKAGRATEHLHVAGSGWQSGPPPPFTVYATAADRLRAVARAVRRGGAPSVALPSYADGSIDPAELSARLTRLGPRDRPTPEDVVLAVLRVAPARLDEVDTGRGWSARVAGPCRGPGAGAASSLGAGHRTGRGPVVARHPVGRGVPRRGPAHGQSGAGRHACSTGRTRWRMPGTCSPSGSTRAGSSRRWLLRAPAAAPSRPLGVARAAGPAPRSGQGPRAQRVLMDAFARSAVPLGAPASSSLVLGLAAKDARVRTSAQDALLDLTVSGLLDGGELGRQAAAHLAEELVVGSRIATMLAEAARADDAAVLPVLDALAALLPVLPGRRDAGAFLESPRTWPNAPVDASSCRNSSWRSPPGGPPRRRPGRLAGSPDRRSVSTAWCGQRRAGFITNGSACMSATGGRTRGSRPRAPGPVRGCVATGPSPGPPHRRSAGCRA